MYNNVSLHIFSPACATLNATSKLKTLPLPYVVDLTMLLDSELIARNADVLKQIYYIYGVPLNK